jgi:uncharacterized protein (TIGR02265 family)
MLPAPTAALTPTTALAEDDAASMLDGFRPAHMVKGMFCSRLVSELGSTFAAMSSELTAPPRLGRYLPFTDYPMLDQARLAFAVARKRSPRAPLGEAVRRLARDDISVFLTSTLGKITVAVVDDPRSALLAVPTAYKHTVRGCRFEAEPSGERGVRLTAFDLPGAWGYQIGQLEGIVMHWRATPTIRCADLGSGRRRFDVTW